MIERRGTTLSGGEQTNIWGMRYCGFTNTSCVDFLEGPPRRKKWWVRETILIDLVQYEISR